MKTQPTNARIITCSAIIFFGFLFLVMIGVKAASFAEKTANAEQNRIDAAFAVLEK